MGCPARRGFITLPFRREMEFSRVYRGFFLSANRLAVVLSHEKIFLGGFLRGFSGDFSKIFKIKKKILDFRFFDCNTVFGHGEHESERFESICGEFDRVFVVIHPREVRVLKSRGTPKFKVP